MGVKGPRLTVVPVTWREAAAFVDLHHRHLSRPNGLRWATSVVTDDGACRGVAIVSHPIARGNMDGRTVEVIRTATDGTPNANSCLYGACRRQAMALGWGRIITYNQEGESGASLRAGGFVVLAQRPARGSWDCPSRPRSDHDEASGVARTLWGAA